MVKWPDNSDINEWYYLAIQEATNSHEPEFKTDKKVTGSNYHYERWIDIIMDHDWLELEKSWIMRYLR
jgi:hypothetical protein